jgi:hypothetical protein
MIVDIKDGSLYKQSKFFSENPDAFSLLLYSDGVEITNPLGAARGHYKIIQVFYTLCDLPKNQQCQTDKLQVALIFREKLLKKYSFQTIYKKMVEDLKKLECGLKINDPQEKVVKVGLLAHAADNLEAHSIGGFSSCFSSNFICRFCLIKYKDLDENIHDYSGESAYPRWTESEYDKIAASLPQHDDESIEGEIENDLEVGELFSQDSDSDAAEEESDEFEEDEALSQG